jgi:hypothetical protein
VSFISLEESKMQDQLYLYQRHKEYLQDEIKGITKIFIEKLFPTFNNIDNEAEKYTEFLFEEFCQSIGSENSDPSDAAEYARDKGIEYYQTLSLTKYGFTAFSISLLYHFWEQQVNKFLFNELKKDGYRIDFKEYSKRIYNIEDTIKLLLEYNVNIKSFSSWNKLDELRLLNNAVKHGNTEKLLRLKEKNNKLFPDWILKDDEALKYIDSCILEEILDISEDNFKEYSDVLIEFWEEFPERSFRKQ